MSKESQTEGTGFSGMIRESRRQQGLSQRQLGEQIGVWNTYVGQIEKGEKVPSDEVCGKLAEVLRLDPALLLVAAYEAKADSEQAKALFGTVRRVLGDPVLQQLLTKKAPLDPQLLEALEEADVRDALLEGSWREMIGRCYRLRKRRNTPGLMALVEAMSDKQWKAMINMLEAMGLEAPK